MARTVGMIALAVLLLGLAGRDTTGDTSLPPVKPIPAKSASAAPPPAAEAVGKRHRVEKSLFKIEVSLKGSLEAADMTEVAYKHHGNSPSGTTPLTIVKAVEHGRR